MSTFLAWASGFAALNLLLVANRALRLGRKLLSTTALGYLVMRSLGGDAISGY